jgi:hypothetical protein
MTRSYNEYPKYAWAYHRRGKKKGSDLKFCSCGMCKFGLHHGKWGNFVAKAKRRAVRHHIKQITKYGYPDVEEEVLKVHVGVTYTD